MIVFVFDINMGIAATGQEPCLVYFAQGMRHHDKQDAHEVCCLNWNILKRQRGCY